MGFRKRRAPSVTREVFGFAFHLVAAWKTRDRDEKSSSLDLNIDFVEAARKNEARESVTSGAVSRKREGGCEPGVKPSGKPCSLSICP